MGFSKGLLIGGLLGTTYALLTAKKTGPQRQQAVVDYLNDITTGAQDVQTSATQLKEASNNLATELKTTAVDSVADISEALQSFSFEAAPRIAQINESLERLEKNLPQ
ncbi:YtxH domain-containing protein [Latilactobacillus fuchuensis]|uniref:YtxH domain-containing protein n=2 Tax=Latilactobacillus fuchuensis TaxID=164393 RepID=A0A2N9DUE0_9LACO|nr:YtxH domain-containing protein [Latilactobacillus fuchuensis]KRL61590.1 hypothetical protein FC69_GL000559 [Latilactobacillus fuchuensis DSM 14340 = JCM 11249]SPC37642.1 conserved hypothetical protein [Latilactobacillus fuchuensis]